MMHCDVVACWKVVEGVPIVQYVNAKEPGDEWPPKYWKVPGFNMHRHA